MNYNQIEIFLAAAETLNFTHAAELLFTSQQSVSGQISNLERDLGFPLFVRNHGSLTLTEAGRRYYSLFSMEIRRGRALLEEIRQDKLNHETHLRLGISKWLDSTGDLAASFRAFESAFPGVSVEPVQDHNRTLLAGLKHHELDLLLLSDWQPLGDPEVVCSRFTGQEVCLYMPEDLPEGSPAPGLWGLPLYHPATWDFGLFESTRILEQRLGELGLSPISTRAFQNLNALRLQPGISRCMILCENELAFGPCPEGYRCLPLKETDCYSIRLQDNVSRIAGDFQQFLYDYFYSPASGLH